MTLEEFEPHTIWFRSAACPDGYEEDIASFLVRWNQDSPHSFCGSPADGPVHNGDDWHDLNGFVLEADEARVLKTTQVRAGEVWIWDGQGRCLDPGRNTVFELRARR